MKLLIHGRNLDVTPALREYTETKLERAIHHFDDLVKEADVHLSVARNPRAPQQTAEVTVFANGTVIRAQERSENLYASIDLVANKLARQLRRFKERQSDHGHRATPTAANDVLLTERPTEDSLLEGKEAQLPSPGVRRKYFAMPAMSLEEARHQLEVIDHDFYLFRDKESDELQVIYHRNHGGFGVIQARN
jgi:putative sigma-54 modulation protein